MNLYIPMGSVKIIYPNNKVKVEKVANSNTVICSGEDKNSAHPQVSISLKSGSNKCPYCGIFFKKHQ